MVNNTISIIISVLALGISAITAWLTLFQKGTIKMTQPTQIFFGPDGIARGIDGPPKVFLRALLYCTAKRGRIIENMFIRLRRGESSQTFNIWVCGEKSLGRGSGLYVGESGVIYNHHFLLPKDSTHYEFLSGEYIIEVFVSLIGNAKPTQLSQIRLSLEKSHISEIKNKRGGVFFDWGPDSGKYHAHVDTPPESFLFDDTPDE